MKKSKKLFFYAFISSLVLFICETLCVLPGPTVLQSPSLILLNCSIFFIIAILITIPVSIYFIISGIVHFKQIRELSPTIFKALACILFITLCISMMWLSWKVKQTSLIKAAQRGEIIIQAISKYYKEHGYYPDSLNLLIPKYLSEVPSTKMMGFPEFIYKKNNIAYELRINCPSGGMNFDGFIYWPNESYPEKMDGNRIERIRNWAYIHD